MSSLYVHSPHVLPDNMPLRYRNLLPSHLLDQFICIVILIFIRERLNLFAHLCEREDIFNPFRFQSVYNRQHFCLCRRSTGQVCQTGHSHLLLDIGRDLNGILARSSPCTVSDADKGGRKVCHLLCRMYNCLDPCVCLWRKHLK